MSDRLSVLAERRKPGRPRVEEPRLPVSSRLAMSEYDALARRAFREGKSLSELVRRAVIKELAK